MDKQVWTSPNFSYTNSTDVEGVGRIRCVDNEQFFRWVLNSGAAATVAGGVYFHATSGFTLAQSTFYEEIFLEGATGTTLGQMAGVAQAVIPIGAYGWIQIAGFCGIEPANSTAVSTTGVNLGGSATAGDNLKGSSGASVVITDTALGTAPHYNRNIVLLGTNTNTTSLANNCLVNCFP